MFLDIFFKFQFFQTRDDEGKWEKEKEDTLSSKKVDSRARYADMTAKTRCATSLQSSSVNAKPLGM